MSEKPVIDKEEVIRQTKEILDGGVAFPDAYHSGMTLRDWFAGRALSSLQATNFQSWEAIAEETYEIADAMLIERGREK